MTTDILLTNPVFLNENVAERELMTPYFPLGLLYLGAYLQSMGVEVAIFDGTFKDGKTDFLDALEDCRPRVVGITAVRPNRENALALARLAARSGARVIMGGPDPTQTPEHYLEEPAVTLVVHHEGEITLSELMRSDWITSGKTGDLASIDGIAYLDERGQVRVNPRRPYILNLDELPIPARELIDMDQYLDIWRDHHGYASLTISVSRGCPYGCEWCRQSVHGRDFRLRSVENVVSEVKALIEHYDIDRLRVVDDVDALDREWINAWARQAEEEGVVVPFEALNELERQDIPMLDVRDSL
jgi:radical SAM superfamily enzyme YgiQ (UPF0313 family)